MPRNKTATAWSVGAPNIWARHTWASFKIKRATGRFKGSWIPNRRRHPSQAPASTCQACTSVEHKWHKTCTSQAKPKYFHWNYIFAGWFLSFHKAIFPLFPSFLSFCACSPPHKCIPVIRKKDAYHSSPPQVTEGSYTAQNLCWSFLFQRHKVLWFPGMDFPGRKRGEESLSPPALTMGCCSTWLCLTSCRTLGCSLTSPTVNWGHVLSWLRPEKKKIDGTRYARYQAHDCWQISKYFCGLCWKHIPGDTVHVYKVFWGEHCSMEKQRRNLTKATLQKAKK